ncbi:helix-turn-helix domain-containing protein [Lujinxingia sediminis]|uniref:helix-turn-helix domain-containing protein n=1 Tax=Lujinxingia sediminis TaxID=2480984 RepID=UPI0013E35B47|nr:helix-turn-helix domain-containing protein [Lujinxingia sediminis]
MNQIAPPQHPDRPRVVTFGGGKGGTGKSTLCADIARALTRHQGRVLCVDASWHSPTLNILLGANEPAFDLGADDAQGLGDKGAHIADFIVSTAYTNVYLASLAAARRYPFTRPRVRPEEIIAQLHQLDFDWVLIDLPPSLSPFDVGLFTLSDTPILVGTPDPAAIRMMAQFLRASLFSAIGYHPEAPNFEDELVEVLYKQPLWLNTRSLRYDAPSAQSRAIIDETARQLEVYMVVNMVREGAEHDLGFVLSHALHRELQVFPRVLASIDYADRRWFYNRRTTGTGSSRNEEGLSNEIELLSRHIRDVQLVDLRYPRPIPARGDAHPALMMGLNPELSRNEVRQYCRRLWEGYRREASISLVFTEPTRRMEIAEELEGLYRHVLTMPSENFSRPEVDEAMRNYERERTAPPPRQEHPTPQPPRPPEFTPPAQPSAHQTETPPDHPETLAGDEAKAARRPAGAKSPGDAIAALRRRHGLSLQELSSRTHIGVKYLAAIETVDSDVLPRPVYLRGYLREISRVFDVPAQPLIEDYFRYLDQS